MIGIYFSGTGNSRYALESLLRELASDAPMFSIEDPGLPAHLDDHDEIVFSYPVQYSSTPKFLSDFVQSHQAVWKGKKVFVIATMALFSGDGAGVLGRLLKKHGARITGGLHLKMPDSIADEKVLKRSAEKNAQLVEAAGRKIAKAAAAMKTGKYPQEGLGLLARMAGFLSQRLWFGHRTRRYSDRLKVDAERCIGCSKCVRLCPTGNLVMEGKAAKGADRCTACYRCVNACPRQAITLLGKHVIEQTAIEKHLR